MKSQEKIKKTAPPVLPQSSTARTRQESYLRLKELEDYVKDFVPSNACLNTIWGHLGWKPEFEAAYAAVKDLGLDLRPMLAPEFADIVSIVVDGHFNFPFPGQTFNWSQILSGQVFLYQGPNPKERLLRLLISTQKECLDS